MATPSIKASQKDEPRERGMLADTFTFPLRSGGWMMIALGAGVSIVLYIASWAPFVGGALGLFSTGFFAAYYLDIINATVNGHDDPPEWPDVTNFKDDIVIPLFSTIGVSLISFAPFLLTFLLDKNAPGKEACEMAGLAFAAVYYPMAMLGFVMHGHLGGAMPHRVFPAIFRALPGYLAPMVLSSAIAGLSAIFEAIARLPLLGILLTAAPSLYLLMAQARVIGLLYRSKREEIGWG